MSVNLTGKNILITGGSSGLGFEMAKELLAHSATVVIAASGEARLKNALDILSKDFENVYAVRMDVTSEESVMEAARWYKANFDHLDLLINGAGVGLNVRGIRELPRGHKFYDVPVDAFRSIVDTNFTGYFIVAKYFVPIFVEQGYGKLAYTSTSTNTMTMPGQLPYGPSKAASEAMTTIIGNELNGTNVTVNVICPGGFTDTGMSSDETKEFFIKNNLPILPPTVMNKIALFLASDKSDGVTGQKFIGKTFDQWLNDNGVHMD